MLVIGEYMKKVENISNLLLKIYIFIFILTMFNRELIPLGIDIRYVQVILSLIIIGYEVYKTIVIKNTELKFKKLILYILTFYLYIVLVNIRWFFNGLKINFTDFINMIILSISNLLTIIVFYLNRKKIDKKYVVRCIMISGIILIISMILVWCGSSLNSIMGGDYQGYYAGGDNTNFIGQEIRVAGYAQDPNYASFFMIIIGATAFIFVNNRKIKITMILLSLIGLILSASKTITIAAILTVLILLIFKNICRYSEKISNILLNLMVILMSVLPYLIIKIMVIFNYSFSMDTMSTRMSMWVKAIELFDKNPIFGNGITSFRSLYESLPYGWYVHSHSTIFQLFSETGIVGVGLFILIIITILKKSNIYVRYLTIVFLFFCLTTELLHLTVFSYILGVLPFIMSENDSNFNAEKISNV